MNKQVVVLIHPYIGILLINRKEHFTNKCSAVDESLRHYIARKKPELNRITYCMNSFM